MPEGHTIHRAARLQSERLVGPPLSVWSPQGRFADGASQLDGGRLEAVTAHGKHLFYRWDDGAVLHVHLGLFGRFRLYGSEPPDPTAGTRLAMSSAANTLYLSGPNACDVIGEAKAASIVERLGPDPLSDHGTGAVTRIGRSLSRRSAPISAALMDQTVVAGIGNVYRSEVLFLAGIHPLRISSEVSEGDVDRLWDIARRSLRRGERSGRIVTVEPGDLGLERVRDIPREERLYVYKRTGLPCRRCGTSILDGIVGGRKAWWCPVCQPA